MLAPLFVAMSVALLFYLVLPVAGAYRSRAQWRRFRERLVALSLAPRLRLGDWLGKDPERLPGRHRLYGAMEAIEGESRMWVRSGEVTALVDLGRSWFHMLADDGGASPRKGGHVLVERLPWSRVRVFPEGAKVFVGGAVTVDGGKPLFLDSPDEPLVVVSYEGPEASLLSRLIAGGRRGNEYWNALSGISISLGIGIMGIYLLLASGAGYFPTVIFLALLVSLAPALALFPPGLPFFFLYLHFWRRGLAARTMRDLLRLPLRFFGEGASPGSDGTMTVPLPEGGNYRMRVLKSEPDGATALLAPRKVEAGGNWVLFDPEGSEDPAARRIAVAGDPESLARRSDREALASMLAAGLSLLAGILLTIVTAFLLWRLL